MRVAKSRARILYTNTLPDNGLTTLDGGQPLIEEDLVVGSPWEVRASDSLIVKNDEPREALALLVTIVDLTNFVILYSTVDHDILDNVVVGVYPTNVH